MAIRLPIIVWGSTIQRSDALGLCFRALGCAKLRTQGQQRNTRDWNTEREQSFANCRNASLQSWKVCDHTPHKGLVLQNRFCYNPRQISATKTTMTQQYCTIGNKMLSCRITEQFNGPINFPLQIKTWRPANGFCNQCFQFSSRAGAHSPSIFL